MCTTAREPGDRPGKFQSLWRGGRRAGCHPAIPPSPASPGLSANWSRGRACGSLQCICGSLFGPALWSRRWWERVSRAADDNASEATSPSDVVITATRTATTVDQLAVPVIVITREEIERALATDLASLLIGRSGLEVERSGGPGQPASVFMRGTDSDHTTVLIDGVPHKSGHDRRRATAEHPARIDRAHRDRQGTALEPLRDRRDRWRHQRHHACRRGVRCFRLCLRRPLRHAGRGRGRRRDARRALGRRCQLCLPAL